MASQRQLSKENSIASILEAALEEFAEKGYTGSTVRSIASRAGVSTGLITRYFGSKDNLLCTLATSYNLSMMYEGVEETDPYRIFCIYISHVRKLQRENPVRFRLILRIVSESDFPPCLYEAVRDGYEGSPLEKAALELQRDGRLIAGDAFSIFRVFSGSVYMILNLYGTIGVTPPDDDLLIHMLGYTRANTDE